MKFKMTLTPNIVTSPDTPPIDITFESTDVDAAKMIFQAALCQTSMNILYNCVLKYETGVKILEIDNLYLTLRPKIV